MAFQSFGKLSGPKGGRSPAPSFGNSPHPTVPNRSISSPPSHLNQPQKVPMDFLSDSYREGPLSPFGASQLANLSPDIYNPLSRPVATTVVATPPSKRSRSPALLSSSGTPFEDDTTFSRDSQRANPSRSPDMYNNHLSQPRATTAVVSQPSKRIRSPTLPSSNGTPLDDVFPDSQRPYIPASRMTFNRQSGSESHQVSAPLRYNTAEIANSRKSFSTAKKTKLPSVSSDRDIYGVSLSSEDESNRELDAKAKRLLRFKDELREQSESDIDPKSQKGLPKRQQLPLAQGHENNGELPTDMDSYRVSHLSDYDGMSSSSIIIGSCLDMCPESERAERERKGDLDFYERVDGDRNQTNESLAIKKYTRTAERETELIRPMPILQKTMDYLLNLLDQPYDDSFLGRYNFLWDRMRAIRMDLRMQHLFSRETVTMLEQMIRLHIIAMHELCEYTKGEGFSEGFDAHLNIEQMNKTSVELFQLYDDLRKNGVYVETEKEFRGFYALLKLDKHPGYKVEPAELSLDLAKMTPDMRQTAEVVFAREVARACRTGNYIAFFRLAQKASYLQACLMHAHFAKLRTQALAALHSGLQMNQGIPVVQVTKWLGMEEEDIQELLEYHGFSLRDFEVPYMVKEGPFLNVDSDCPVKCSRLVQLKKSSTIVNDVAYSSKVKPYPLKEKMVVQPYDGIQQKHNAIQSVKRVNTALAVDEKMPDRLTSPRIGIQKSPMHKPDSVPSPKTGIQKTPMLTVSTDNFSVVRSPRSPQIPPPWYSSSPGDPQRSEARVESPRNSKYDVRFRNSLDRSVSIGRSGLVDMEEAPSHSISEQMEIVNTPSPEVESVMHISAAQQEEHLGLDRVASGDKAASTSNDDVEVFEAKLKLILRTWKRLASKKRASREHRKLLADAALTSLPLGLPISRPETQSSPSGDFDIDAVMRNRVAIQEKSWAKLNVAEVVSSTLEEKNPYSKCFCWKLLLCAKENSYSRKEDTESVAISWLLSKLIPRSDGDHEDHPDLSYSSSSLSIWNKWFPSSNDEPTCCLSVVHETTSQNVNEAVPGTSAILFYLSGRVNWDFERNRLQNILMALPLDSQLPLLILVDSCKAGLDPSTVVQELCLNGIDRSRISSFNVAFLNYQHKEQLNVFFDDEQLRKGLQWLAHESPPQPVLSCIRTRELVLKQLKAPLEILNGMPRSRQGDGPNSCINAFNNALDQSLAKIMEAVHSNPTSWPCPEISYLDEFSHEYKAVLYYLPQPGWSLNSRIEPLIRRLTDCKLPAFQDDISWLYSGADRGNFIEEQRIMLESILINYFSEVSQVMALPLASKEVPLLLQKFVQLELQNSTYYIKPDWVKIFQRMFNWRLMELSDGELSIAHILSKDDVSIENPWTVKVTEPLFSSIIEPTLDEMLAVGYNPVDDVIRQASLNVEETLYIASDGDMEEDLEIGGVEDRVIVEEEEKSISYNDYEGSEIVSLGTPVKEQDDRLSALFERCNIVQNMNQEKLSIYF